MSNIRPGYWQASDGNWYPPEAAPNTGDRPGIGNAWTCPRCHTRNRGTGTCQNTQCGYRLSGPERRRAAKGRDFGGTKKKSGCLKPFLVVAALFIVLGVIAKAAKDETTTTTTSSASWPAGVTRESLLAPVIAVLQSCAQAATLSPANCPQTDRDSSTASGIAWELHGDPGAGAQISNKRASFTVAGTAIMRLQFVAYETPYLKIVPVFYRAMEHWTGSQVVLDGISPVSSDSQPTITKPAPLADNAVVLQAFKSAFTKCFTGGTPTLVTACPQVGTKLPSSSTGVRWHINTDPLLNAKVTYDSSNGLYHVVGSYSVSASYRAYDSPGTANASGNYDAALTVDNGVPVVLTITATT